MLNKTRKEIYKMKRTFAVLAVMLMLLAMLSGCSDKKTAAPAAAAPVTILTTALTYSPVNVIPQFIPSSDGAVAPGMANFWDILPDLSLADGGDDQFDMILGLTVGTTDFPMDQVYSELTFTGPLMGAAEGAMVVSVSSDTTSWYSAITGTYSAFIYPTGNSILQQTVVLTSATGTVTLNYSIDGASYGGSTDWGSYITGAPDTFRIVVRNSAGTELEEIYSLSDSSDSGDYTADLTAYRGQVIAIAFEHQGQQEPIVIDNVSVTDSAATEFVTNGDFETGVLAPWISNTAANLAQNMTSGTRTLESLDVTRSFYTVPNKLWGRWVDVFSNPTGSDIAITISYYNELGNDTYGIIYTNPSTTMAVTSWDGNAWDRDIAFVYGNATTIDFTSDDGLGNGNGSDLIPTTYDITVPAGGTVAIVNFIVMGGTDTGQTALDDTATADEVDAVAAAIVADFWTDAQYTAGMTQAQKDAVSNF